MIIGTVTLISILLSGGSYNTFVFADLDKYVKKVIVDKERNKEMSGELKIAKKNIKNFYKERKNGIKDLKNLNLDRNSQKSQFDLVYQVNQARESKSINSLLRSD